MKFILNFLLIFLLVSEANAGSYNTQANLYRFAATRLRINTINVTTTAGSEYFASQITIKTPDYQVNNLTCGYMGTWIQAATSTPEQPQGSEVSLDGVALLLNGVRYPFVQYRASGNAWKIPSGGYLWVQAKTPRPIRQTDTVQIITTGYSPTGATRAGGARIKPYLNEGVVYGATSQSSYLTGGTVGNSIGVGNLQYAVAPVTCVATGWDGRPTPLTIGDSINYGSVEYINYGGVGGELGWLDRGLSSTAYGARRYPSFDMGVATSRLQDFATIDTLLLRKAFFAALPNLPFNRIYIQLGTNSGSASAPTWQSQYDTFWSVLDATWPGIPKTQFTMPAKVQALGTAGFTTIADQGYTTTTWWAPAGAGDTVNSYILTTPAPLAASLDVRPSFSGSLVGGSVNTWREDIYFINCTVATAVTSGESFIRSSCPLNINTAISVGVGTAQVEQVIVSSNPVSVSCPCQSSVFSAFLNNHSVSDVIKETPTPDGTHGVSTAYQRSGDEAIGFAKASGILN